MRTFIAVLLLAVTVVSCGETYPERLNRYYAKKLADVNDRKTEVDLLRDKCAADEKTYIANMKAPFLKSCLEYLSELKSGVDDRAEKTQCSEDMQRTLPSCQEWGSKRQALLDSLQEDMRESDERQNYLHRYGVPPPLPDE
jgi:hypothetical protein